jgi:hypothetical protein
MKTVNFIKAGIIAGLIFTTTLTWSNTDPAPASTSTTKTIRDYFKFPQMLLPYKESAAAQTNKVEVLFTTGKDGKVTPIAIGVAFAKTPNWKLKYEIEKQFMLLLLKDLKENVVHSIVLNFKTL